MPHNGIHGIYVSRQLAGLAWPGLLYYVPNYKKT